MWSSAVLILLSLSSAAAKCFEPSPAFPIPDLSSEIPEPQRVFDYIGASLREIVSDQTFNTSSFSVEVTSSQETLWSSFHTARERNLTRIGADTVDGRSVYRIASITKAFTVLGILKQHAAGNLSLDNPVADYVVELQKPQVGNIPWKDITLRSLASQLSGLPREYDNKAAVSGSDLLNGDLDPATLGLPPLSRDGLPDCGEYSGYENPCSEKDFLDIVRADSPLFAPNQKSTYSNLAFDLLGLVLENVTGMSYTDYVTSAIFEPLSMNSTSLEKPTDKYAVLPKGHNYWDVDEPVQRPTGGIYSSSSDVSKFLRYVLTHYNGLTPALNWFNPVSFSTGGYSSYGMPWEMFRTSKIIGRPTTFVTKGGGLPGYFSLIILMPEYDLGVTILVGGELDLLFKLREAITIPLVRAVDEIAMMQLAEKYSGVYVSTNASLNSSLTLTVDPSTNDGLVVRRFISNGTDVLASPLVRLALRGDADKPWRAQLVPTLLYRDEKNQNGELWRILIALNRPLGVHQIWDDACDTDVDPLRYAGLPLNEVIFWADDDGHVVEAELSAFRVILRRQSAGQRMRSESQKVLE